MMSVIAKRMIDDKVFIYTKGADTNVMPRCTSGFNKLNTREKNDNQIKAFCKAGYQVLCSAMRQLTESEVAELMNTDMENNSELQDRLENQLNFLGLVALEEILDQNVPRTIKRLKQAKIKTWIVTGDAMDTAVAAGRLARIIP